MRQLTVALDGSGDFISVQAAIDAIRVHWQEDTRILIKNGVYHEKIIIPDNKTRIWLVGESREGTILSNNEFARIVGADGEEIGTFLTPVLTMAGDDCRLENLTVQNTAGYGPEIGQALALYVAGDRITVRNVSLFGNQDTLYTCKGRNYFHGCYIEGHVDFIFGGATVVFEECEIHSLRDGYITAASTEHYQPYGYVFLNCRLTGAADNGTVFLGRPWRPFAHTAFINTWMGAHIHAEGWDHWNDPNNEATVRYYEYGSTGPGANQPARVGWSKLLTQEEAEQMTPARILAGRDGWKPSGEEAPE
ncbi:pectin esterase [Paenibacillus sp. LMG 31456]|uniref:Pectin esterase n=1 Tax=Paenibacillus foliorum TaxID=2654974 RepID=A0A972H2P4_9BACL|nr:pectinesterase family protein [Paenibacillus foliorum]NOU95161.1 pectin esterase [Paenibacillus foliorum]